MHYTTVMIYYQHLISTSSTYPRLRFVDIVNELMKKHKLWNKSKPQVQNKPPVKMANSMTDFKFQKGSIDDLKDVIEENDRGENGRDSDESSLKS